MRASPLGLACLVAVASACALAACSAAPSHQFTSSGTGASSGAGASTSGTLSGSSTGGSTATNIAGSTSVGPGSSSSSGMTVSSAYAHTANTLFKLDPTQPTLGLTQIGTFDCIGNGGNEDYSMTDLAVDENGNLWGISSHFVYPLQIQGSTVHCENSYALNAPNGVVFYGLTFAPAGVLGAGEVLVAANTEGQLYGIEVSGNNITLTQHGTFGPVPSNDTRGHNYPSDPSTGNTVGQPWELSGDIVFVKGSATSGALGFATVRDCANPPSTSKCSKTDTLIEIDMTKLPAVGSQDVTKSVRGQVLKAASCNDPNNTSYGGMYGIAASGSDVFGFAHSAQAIVKIDNNDGSACLVVGTNGNSWDGAAITTVANVVPPTIM